MLPAEKILEMLQNKKALNHAKRKYAPSKILSKNLNPAYLFYIPPREVFEELTPKDPHVECLPPFQ